MVYFTLIILTILSCILFEYANLSETLKELVASYKQQFKVMSDKSHSDEIKQKLLLEQISRQLRLLAKLIFGIILFVAPFLSLFVLEKFWPILNPDILISWWGILIPTLTVILYIILKRNYGKLLGNR